MATMLDHIATVISDASLASTSGAGGFYLWKGLMPDSTAVAAQGVALLEDGGAGTEQRTSRERPGLTVLVRGASVVGTSTAYETARTQIDRIWARIKDAGVGSLSSWHYAGIWPRRSPHFLGFDDVQRPVFAAEFRVERAANMTPNQFGECVLWLAADHLSGLSDGDSVTTWLDGSGNGHNASQSTAAKKPTYKASIVNGLPVVRFDGVDDVLDVADAAGLDALTGLTVFAVTNALVEPPGNFGPIVGKGDGAPSIAGATWLMWYSVASSRLRLSVADVTQSAEVVRDDRDFTVGVGAGTNILAGVWNGGTTDASISIYRNGAQVDDTNGGDGVFVAMRNTTSDVKVGGGANSGSAKFLQGDIAEVAVVGRTLDATERAAFERALAHKYAVTLS